MNFIKNDKNPTPLIDTVFTIVEKARLAKEKYDKDDFFNFEQDIRIEKRLWYNILVE